MEKISNIAEILKDARKKSGMDYKELAHKTKINVSILKALEEGNLEKLPNIIYVKGFVKILCKTFKINQEQTLLELNLLYNPQVKKPKILIDTNEETPREESKKEILDKIETQEKIDAIKKVLFDKKTLIALGVIVFIIIIIKVFSSFISSLKEEQTSIQKTFKTEEVVVKEEIAPESQDDDESIKPVDSELFQSKTLEDLKKDAIVAKPVEIKEEVVDKKEKNDVISEGKKFPFKNFYPAPNNVFDIIENSDESKDLKLLPQRYRDNIDKNVANVLIYAEADTWISYKLDDEAIKRYILKAGKHLMLNGKLVLLFLGNFNSTKIFYNNNLIAAQTTTGVKSLIFPEESAKDLNLPLFPSYKGIPYSQQYYKENMSEENSN